MSERDKFYGVSELAREFNLTPQALRFYEEKGLIHPARSGKVRVFTYKDRARLILINKLKRLGFSLEDIAEYISFYNKEEGNVALYRLGLVKIAARIADLEKKRNEIDGLLDELRLLEGDAQQRLNNSLTQQKKG